MIEKKVWQYGKGFNIEAPVNLQNNRVYDKRKKSDIPDENLLSLIKNMATKVMVFTEISWYGVTKPFFCK